MCYNMITETNEDTMDNKKLLIIQAGLKCFAKNGYDKTSINDIIETAKVSKGLLFYHFTSKKQFYLDLIDYCGNYLKELYGDDYNNSTDFFERIEDVMQKRIMFMLKQPYAYQFLMSVYNETNALLTNQIQERLNNYDLQQLVLYTSDTNTSKFKDQKDVMVCVKMITWITDGLFKGNSFTKQQIKHKIVELMNYIQIIKKMFYKR